MLKREVLYPIFLLCASQTNDIFWKETFEEMSYGNCISGVYISKKTCLCSNVKGREFNYKFIDKDEKTIYNDIIKLLMEKFNIMSKNDRKILNEELKEIEKYLKGLKNQDWTSLKKKSYKDIVFQNFLIEMKKKWKLNINQIKKIHNFINLGLMLKSIKNTDIIYENGKITEIIGITFTEGKYEIDIDIYSGLDDDPSLKNNCKKEQKYLKLL